ncbi:hypothetical protein HanPSC8_Chr04g0145011 [Helianthus annuus]|nr:hypothetical protein HanPSC8_Chr04g0145011 [Helianthus annuus]
MEKIRASEERLFKEKADFEAYKRTEQWAAAAGHKQVRSLNHLISEERKLWKEDCARENEKLYHLHQENVNLKAANAALVKEQAAAVAAMKDAEASHEALVKALEEANVRRARMAKTIEEAKTAYVTLEQEDSRKELQAREVILAVVNRRLMKVEARAAKAEEERDDMATTNANLVADRTWMRNFSVFHVVNAILDALENTNAVAGVVGRAREAGYKANYIECIAHVNVVSAKKFTD